MNDGRIGLTWTMRNTSGNLSVPSRDLGAGTSGAVISLAILYSQLGERFLKDAALEGVRWINATSAFEEPRLAGVFVGESGVALALLVAGTLLNEPQFQAKALALARSVSSQPLGSPDLYHGTAGRLLLHLRLWEELGVHDQLVEAERLGSSLIEEADIAEDHSIAWLIPSEYGALASSSWLGMAHGIAGVGYALCRLYETTKNKQILKILLMIADTLKNQAIQLGSSGQEFAWPKAKGEDRPVAPFWCHGATGIGRFFLIADRIGIDYDSRDYAIGAAETVRNAPWLGPTQCHGLAGSIDFLLDVAKQTGQQRFNHDAQHLMRILATYANVTTEGLQWLDRETIPFDHGLMPGCGGIVSCLLRASAPDSIVSLHDLLLDNRVSNDEI